MPRDRDRDAYDVQTVSSSYDAVPATAGSIQEMTLQAQRDDLQVRVDSLTTELKNLGRIRDDFIAAASHDLKSPLTAILGGAQLIERLLEVPVPDVGNALKWTRVIQDRVRVMTLLINDLLDASRIQTGAYDLRVASCDVNACVATVVARLGHDVSARIVASPASQPVHGEWDRQRIEQVLANLLDNALKYSPSDTTIAVVVETQPEEVQVTVSDGGVGIPTSELPRLFDRFYRSANADGSTVAGVGLGLYICKEIVTAHGGRLWAESRGVDRGASFRFTLPLLSAAVVAAAMPHGEQGT